MNNVVTEEAGMKTKRDQKGFVVVPWRSAGLLEYMLAKETGSAILGNFSMHQNALK